MNNGYPPDYPSILVERAPLAVYPHLQRTALPYRTVSRAAKIIESESQMADYLHLEDLAPGQSWSSPARTLLESDIASFAGLTGDYDPLHVDHEHAAATPYGRPIAHGLLGLGFMAGLSSTCPRVRTLAFVRIEDWRFLKPMYSGDTVHVMTAVEAITPKGRRSGEVVWERKLFNQRDECVQSGRIVTLVAARNFLPRTTSVPVSKLEKFRTIDLSAGASIRK